VNKQDFIDLGMRWNSFALEHEEELKSLGKKLFENEPISTPQLF